MKRALQAALLWAYALVARTGLPDTAIGRRLFIAAYSVYKARLELGSIAPLRALVAPGTSVLDVGAHIGTFALQAAPWVSAPGRVHAFEPEARNHRMLAERIRARGLTGIVDPVRTAVSDTAGTANLLLNPAHPGDHYLVDGETTAGRERVDAVTLDTYVAEREVNDVSLVKIDVQGAELRVLAGARQMIERDRPALFVEVDDTTLRRFGESAPGLINALAALGYRPHRLRAGEITPALTAEQLLAELAAEGYADVLFLPAERSEDSRAPNTPSAEAWPANGDTPRPAHAPAPYTHPWHGLLPAALILAFLALQIGTIDYGTRVNDLPYFRAADLTSADIGAGDSALTRASVVDSERASPETPAKWAMRFALYSVEADEHINLIALARIHPAELALDPHFYQYGGAYLYPLGAWYFALGKLGLIRIASLDSLLAEPNVIDRYYVAGRLFVLLAFTISALVLYRTARLILPPPQASLALLLYLLVPATLRYSHLMKPHWYALIFALPVIHVALRCYLRGRGTRPERIALGLGLGLAVGSATTYAPFAVLVWIAMALGVRRGVLPTASLVTVPAIALATWFVTNPYLFLNREAAAFEAAKAAGWFALDFGPETLGAFLINSYLPGFGVLGLLALGLAVKELMRPSAPASRALAITLLAVIGFAAVLTASLSGWHTNARYLPYFLPIACIYAAWLTRRWPRPAIGLVVALTAAHAVPMAIGYHDENDPRHSTRLASAAWINANVPARARICPPKLQLAPFNIPPFDFTRLRIRRRPDCDWLVAQGETARDASRHGPGWRIERVFEPRIVRHTPSYLQSHINPTVVILRHWGR